MSLPEEGGEYLATRPELESHPAMNRRASQVRRDDVPVAVVAERVQYYGNDGKLITESLRDYTEDRSGRSSPRSTSS